MRFRLSPSCKKISAYMKDLALSSLPVQDPNDPDFARLRKFMIDLINQNYRQLDGSPGVSDKDVNDIVGMLILACPGGKAEWL
jgi:hypothetical protein